MQHTQPLALVGLPKLKAMAAAVAMVALSGTAQAALMSLGDGTVKETNTNLIWLQDWNISGVQNWADQKAWAEGLAFANSSEWRLPTIAEYLQLFGLYGDLTMVNEFTDVQGSDYWSGSGSGLLFRDNFRPDTGTTFDPTQDKLAFAVAVRLGDATAAVPEPQTLALGLLALGATLVARRRRPLRP